MARFNQPAVSTRRTVNHEGAPAYSMDAELELYSLVCTASLQNKFYEKASDTITRMRKLMMNVDPMFVAQLAVYAREKMFLRSVPLVIAVEMAKIGYRGPLRKMVTRIIQRPDEITEILSYYQAVNERSGRKKLGKLAKALQKGIADAFRKFDEYQLAKYNRDGQVRLRDALFLSHAKPANEEQATLFKKLIDGTMAVPDTWEVKLSQAGQDDTPKKKVWEDMIASKKLGYMALLRNLRNILEAGVDREYLVMACEYLSSKDAVLKSRQFPFRFLSAYREVSNIAHLDIHMVLQALETAVIHSVHNLKGFDEKTRVCIACDVSGSMQHSISEKSTVQYFDIGIVLGMLLQNKCTRVITGMFGNTWKALTLPKDTVLASTNQMHSREGEVGYATNGHGVILDLHRQKIEVDKVMMFTDCQMWNSQIGYGRNNAQFGKGNAMQHAWYNYRKDYPNAKLYLFDLKGYGTTPIELDRGNNVYLVAGWSNEIFSVLEAIDAGESAVARVKEIVV